MVTIINLFFPEIYNLIIIFLRKGHHTCPSVYYCNGWLYIFIGDAKIRSKSICIVYLNWLVWFQQWHIINSLSRIFKFSKIKCPPFIIYYFELLKFSVNLRSVYSSKNHIAFLSNILSIIISETETYYWFINFIIVF